MFLRMAIEAGRVMAVACNRCARVKDGCPAALTAKLSALLALVTCVALPDRATAQSDTARATRLMAQYQCAACHRIPGVAGGPGVLGPDLAAYGARSYIVGRWPNNPAQLAAWIIDPPSRLPGTRMPALGVSPADARDIAAYLATLR